MMTAPAADEFAPAFAGYVGRVATVTDPLRELAAQHARVRDRLSPLDDDRAAFRYAPDKWSIKDVVNHLSDAERVFSYRLLRVARGDDTPLASFDENAYARAARADSRPLAEVVHEWSSVREATMALARSVPDEAWMNRGVSPSGSPMTARALLYIVLGHTEHHLAVLSERYGV